jgi:hypothetical protein
MTAAPATAPEVIRFHGWISCRRDGEGPLGLVLVGRTLADERDESVQVAFSSPAPDGLPEALEDPRVESLGNNQYRLASGDQSWTLRGPIHVHREIAAAFYKAVPPRPVPWRKRLFWRVMLALAAHPLGRRLLLRGR